jgi:hypothetical protein
VHSVYGPWTAAGLGPPWTRPHTASGLLITAALPGSNDWERMTEVVAVLPLVHGRGAVGVWPELHSGVRRHTAIGRRERGEDGEGLGSVGDVRGGWRQAHDSEEQAATLCSHQSWAARPLRSTGAHCN